MKSDIEQNAPNKKTRGKYIIPAVMVLCAIAGYVYMAATWSPVDSESQKASEYKIRKIAARNFQKSPDQLNDEDFSQVTRLIIGESKYSSAPMIMELADIKLLEKFTNLEVLSLGRIVYPKKYIPKWMTVLQKVGIIDIDKRFALDLSPLEKLQTLQMLTISNTSLKSIKPLSNLVNLQTLSLSGTNIKNIEPVKNLINLQQLFLDGTEISNLKPIKNLKNLEYLCITRTKIINLEPMRELTNLQTFYAHQTQISDLEPLKELTNMKYLYIGVTEISDLEPIKNLTELEVLDISNTIVSNLVPIKGFKKLQRLYLQNCKKITDEQVEDLKKAIPNLDTE